MSDVVKERMERRGGKDVVVVERDPTIAELAARIAALEAALDKVAPNWRKG